MALNNRKDRKLSINDLKVDLLYIYYFNYILIIYAIIASAVFKLYLFCNKIMSEN